MLYRKYRPASFSEVIGQEDVVRTLRGALATGRVGHAYLFAGPRGTGKTTLARIMAKAVNCGVRTKDEDPCNACESCVAMNEGRSMDLIEIDAASHTGIDDVRALKEAAGTAAAGGSYKVFVIDEVHGLSPKAFDALLKLLEEPPPHVLFLMATTEAHKLKATVLSRLQRLNIRRLNPEEIAGKLRNIARREKVDVPGEGLAAIARASDGALRDAEVMLSKVIADASSGAAEADAVYELLGLVPDAWFEGFCEGLFRKDRPALLADIRRIERSGADADHVLKGLLERLRALLMAKVDNAERVRNLDGKYLVSAIQAFTGARRQLRSSPIAFLPMELAVLELTGFDKAS